MEKYSWNALTKAIVNSCRLGREERNSAHPAISPSRSWTLGIRVADANASRFTVRGMDPCCKKLRRRRRCALPTIFRPFTINSYLDGDKKHGGSIPFAIASGLRV